MSLLVLNSNRYLSVILKVIQYDACCKLLLRLLSRKTYLNGKRIAFSVANQQCMILSIPILTKLQKPGQSSSRIISLYATKGMKNRQKLLTNVYPAALPLLLARLSTTLDAIKNYISMFWLQLWFTFSIFSDDQLHKQIINQQYPAYIFL